MGGQPGTTELRDALAERLRTALSGREVREVRMFGGISFMVEERMVVAAGRDGDLLVRIDPARNDELAQITGASGATMGANRPMGPGWITIAGDRLASSKDLAFWIQIGLEYHAAQRDDSH